MKKLIKINLKRNIWLTGCLSLVFILCRPMMQLLTYENAQRYTIVPEDLISTMEGFFLPDYFTDFVPTLLACAVIGFVYFSFLFSKRQVDLYHSIPVNRKHLFISNYASGIITYIIALLAEYIICIAIAIPNHYFTMKTVSNILIALVCNLIHFIYGYGIIVCAVMLTGNIIVSVAASAVFALIYPVVAMILSYMERYFYVTFTSSESVKADLLTKYYWLSPITSYATVIQRTKHDWTPFFFETASEPYVAMILPFIMAIIVTAIAYLLYSKRPSEAAGRAIAFRNSRPIIEIPISIIGGLLGVWFMSISVTTYKSSWIWGGAVLGVLLSHLLLEIIINESFKALFSHKMQLLCTVIVTILIVGIYYGDFTKYDSYVPNRNNIKTVGIYFEGIDNNLSYIEPKPDEKNPGYYNSKYYMGQNYAFTNRLSNEVLIDKVLGVANIGVTCVNDMISAKNIENDADYYLREAVEETNIVDDMSESKFVEGMAEDLDDEEAYNLALKWMEENGYHEIDPDDSNRTINIQICYELKSGKIVLRQYDIPLSKALASIGDIYNSEEYNLNHFDIYKGYENGIISKVEIYDSYEQRIGLLTEADKDKLMDTYISELKNITLDTISQVPIGRIVPSYKASELYDESYSGYYIYPEYKKTLALIESYGVDMTGLTAGVDASEIVSINLSSYSLYGRSNQEYAYVSDVNYDSINDKMFLKEIAPKLINANNVWSNELLIDNKTNSDKSGVDMMVYITPENGIQRTFSVRFKDGVLPERIKKDVAIKLWTDNQF